MAVLMVAKISKATATRHLADLLEKGCLEKMPRGGRNSRYQINMTPSGDGGGYVESKASALG